MWKRCHSSRGRLTNISFNTIDYSNASLKLAYCPSESDFINWRLRPLTFAFKGHAARSLALSNENMVQEFIARSDSIACRKDNNKIFSTISLESTRWGENDKQAALNGLIELIELLRTIEAPRDRDFDARSRNLLHIVSQERCFLHKESKHAYLYDFAIVMDAINPLAPAIRAHNVPKVATRDPPPTLLTTQYAMHQSTIA